MPSAVPILRGSQARHVRFLLPWLAHAFLLTAIPPVGRTDALAEPAQDKRGRLDLHLKSPYSAVGIEGDWIYKPLDGSASYRVTIRSTRGGFYEFEGVREGSGRPVIELDRAEEGSLYRGEVIEGFDPCIPAGARFSLLPTSDALVFEPAMPVSVPPGPGPRGACAAVTHYYLAAKGHGDRVRLRAADDLSGGGRIDSAPGQASGRVPSPGETGWTDRSPAASVKIGGPTAPDGAQVLVTGSLRDATQKLWHRVQLVGNPEEPDEDDGTAGKGRAAEEARDGESSRTGKTRETREPAPERDPGSASGTVAGTREPAPKRDPGSASGTAAGTREPAPPERDPGSAKEGGDSRTTAEKRSSGPTSGYVPAESLVVRWECRLVRSEPGTKP